MDIVVVVLVIFDVIVVENFCIKFVFVEEIDFEEMVFVFGCIEVRLGNVVVVSSCIVGWVVVFNVLFGDWFEVGVEVVKVESC